MLNASLALVFLGLVIVALHFFGGRALKQLAPAMAQDAGMAIAYGAALFLAYCGCLEVTALASRFTLSGPVFIGLAGSVATTIGGRDRPLHRLAQLLPKPLTVPAVVLLTALAFLLVLFLVNAADWHYGSVDDRHGYLVFPERIISEGSSGRDPFLMRRIEVGLSAGGAYFYALFRAAFDMQQTRLADVGLGGLCLLLLVAGHAREYGASATRLSILLLTTFAVIVFSPIINNTPETLGKALFYALLRLTLATTIGPPAIRRGLALAPLVFAVLALKTTFLPFAVAPIAALYLFRAKAHAPVRLIPEVVALAAVTLLLMLPWMIVEQQIAGTPWYPIVGLGTLRSEETSGIVILPRFITEAGRLMLILLPATIVADAAWLSPEWRRQRLFFVLLVGCTIVLTLLTQLKFSLFGYRYGHMGPATLLVFFLIIALRCDFAPLLRKAVLMTALISMVVMAVSNTAGRRWIEDGAIGTAVFGPWLFGPAKWRDDRRQDYVAMQQAVPAGAPLLVILSWPSLLDFQRNTIMVMDWPAMMGPSGMPDPTDVPAWRDYLYRNGVRYIAYSYGDEAGYSSTRAVHDLAIYADPATYSVLQLTLASRTQEMHDTFVALSASNTIVYDDGQEFVVQLAPP